MSDKYPGGFVTTGAPAGFSVAFDGSGDILTTPASANLALGTGAFTVECWFYTNGNGSDGLISAIDSASGNYSAAMYFSGSTTMKISIQSGVAAAFDSGNITFTPYTWNHAVLVRDGSGNCAAFFNGTRRATGTTSQNITQNLYNIGRTYVNTGAGTFNGYISNARIVKGTAVYDPAQTTLNIPTQLFNIANTQLLICQSPTIIDNSNNAFAITVSGNAAVSNFTPFAGYTGFNPALGAAAGGVWTLDEAAYYQNNRQWPIYDPYFNRTTLMLHGNGTNAAQNNTFLDSSTNNFTITRNGNTTQGTFTPFSQAGWSLYLPGSGTNYVQTPSNTTSALLGGSLTSLATLSFTIECFVNVPTSIFLVGACDPGGGTADMILGVNSDGTLSFGATFGGYTTRNSTGAISFNQWNHVAWVVTGGYVYFYVNGAPAGSATVGNTAGSYSQLVFGGYNNSFSTKQYVSNFRITKSALYSGAFTPPTTKLTASTNTTLLTFQDYNYKDNSANNYAMVVVGSPYIQNFSPFVPTTSTPITYSNWFDGSGDYLTAPDNAAFSLASDFTVECWWYPSDLSASSNVWCLGDSRSANNGLLLYWSSGSGKLLVYSNGATVITSSINTPASAWYHLAIVRSGAGSNNLTLYINGVSAGTATNTTSFASVAANGFSICAEYAGSYVAGKASNISNLRVLKGTALYTAAFTPPTAPLTAITNTSLLTCQSSTFIDNSTNNLTLTSTGSTQPVASPNPFGFNTDQSTLNTAYSATTNGGAAYLDGSGDYLNLASAINFGTNAFTIEGWYYISTTGQQGFWGESNGGGPNNKVQLYIYPSNSLTLDFGTGPITGISGLTASTYLKTYAWNHIVVCRTGTGTNQTALFINGVRAGVGTSGNQTGVTDTFKIGSNELGVLSAGYISGFRIVNGASVYDPTQVGFAPPTAPPTAIANTYLLTNFTNAGIIDSTGKNVFETVDAAQISTAQSKYGGSSISCVTSTASGAYPVATFNNNLHAFYTGDFTVEAWIYLTTLSFDYSGAPAVINYGSGGANGPLGTATTWALMVLSTGTGLRFYRYDGSTETYYDFTSSAGTIPSGQWVHVAVSRSGTSMRGFVNGVPIGSTASSSLSYSPTSINKLYLGIASGGGGANQYYRLPGYIDDARITKGYARYTTTFTPPTSQMQDQ